MNFQNLSEDAVRTLYMSIGENDILKLQQLPKTLYKLNRVNFFLLIKLNYLSFY